MTTDAMRFADPPWYRQRWPWLLIAGPAIVVIAALFTAWLAAATDDGVIADDYYKRGLLINKEIDRTSRAEAMHLAAVLRVDADGAATLAMTGFTDPAAAPTAVRVLVTHPTRAGHRRVEAADGARRRWPGRGEDLRGACGGVTAKRAPTQRTRELTRRR